MLFRPSADQRLDAINALLVTWNGEADRFRAVAMAARRGEQPSSSSVDGAEEAHDGLIALLDEIDQVLQELPSGHVQFAALLRSQNSAVALLESIGSSLTMLDRFASDSVPAPRRIGRGMLAAE